MTVLRAAVVGTRGVGAAHVAALQALPGVEVVAVAASSHARARAAADRLGVPRAPADHRELVGDPAIDVVHVCTPNDSHAEIAGAALEHGKHVVCEKPLAVDAASAQELAARAAASRTVAAVGYNYRHLPLVAQLRSAVRAGRLGTVHAVRGSYLQNWLLSPVCDDWRDDPGRGGSSRVLLDIGTHLLDLVEVVTGSVVTEATAALGAARPGARDDHADVLLRLTDGVGAALSVSQVSAAHTNTLTLTVDGDLGSATWRFNGRERLEVVAAADVPAIRLEGHVGAASAQRRWDGPPVADGGLSAFLAAVYARVAATNGCSANGVPPACFRDGLRHVELIDAAVRSAAHSHRQQRS